MIRARAAQIYRDNAQSWVAPAPTGTGTTIWVQTAATGGNDSTGNGSSGSPYATLHKADSVATAGSVIRVRPGTYQVGTSATYALSAAGTSSNRITWWSEGLHQAKLIPAATSNAEFMLVKLSGGYQNFMGFDVSGLGGTTANGNPFHWGVYAYCVNPVTVQYCYVHDILTDQTEFNNTTSNGSGGAGINMDASLGLSGVLVDGNIVTSIGFPNTSSPEIHAIYVVAAGTYSNNLVYNVSDGIQSYHHMTSVWILNNTVDNCANIGILIAASGADGNHCRVYNNIISNGSRGIIEAATTGTDNIYLNNTIFNMSSTAISLQNGLTATGTLTTDPQYVNRPAHNFHLLHSSPSYRAGTSTTPVTSTDQRGFTRSAPRDRGCYQE